MKNEYIPFDYDFFNLPSNILKMTGNWKQKNF